MQIVDTFKKLPEEAFDYRSLSAWTPTNSQILAYTLTHSELDVQLIKHIRKILVSQEPAIPSPFQTKEDKPARCANVLECLRSSPRHRGTNLLSILHNHVDLIHRMRPDCHVDHINDVVVLQRPKYRDFA